MNHRVIDRPELLWIDIVDPSKKELQKIADEFKLHPASVKDCLDPEHLPKFEKIGEVKFLILRAFDDNCSSDADDMQELTRKLAIFIGKNFIISVHRKDQPFLIELRKKWASITETYTFEEVLADLISSTIRTYEAPIDAAYLSFETLENQVFITADVPKAIEAGYYLKRKASVFRRILRLTTESIHRMTSVSDASAPLLQDWRENAERYYFYAEDLLENVNNLLSLYVQLESQKTNEIMRLLTVFSVFFMPLNFIAGVYGMNFEHMPELKHEYAYPAVLALMVVVSMGVYLWIRKRGWLR